MASMQIARGAGLCQECGCRYRAGELVMAAAEGLYHADCYRTRGSYELRPYEDQQPVELDLLLIAIRTQGVSSQDAG